MTRHINQSLLRPQQRSRNSVLSLKFFNKIVHVCVAIHVSVTTLFISRTSGLIKLKLIYYTTEFRYDINSPLVLCFYVHIFIDSFNFKGIKTQRLLPAEQEPGNLDASNFNTAKKVKTLRL